jgi:hypothetical protein
MMEANSNQGPRVVYMNKSGQTVSPATGKTVGNADPEAHHYFAAMTSNTLTRINELAGTEMSGVSFVRDYVELLFDGTILRMLTPPVVRTATETCRIPDAGCRDLLCSLIGQIVVDFIVIEDDRIEVRYANGATVGVSLRREDRDGPEAAHYVPGDNQPILVW